MAEATTILGECVKVLTLPLLRKRKNAKLPVMRAAVGEREVPTKTLAELASEIEGLEAAKPRPPAVPKPRKEHQRMRKVFD